VGLPDPIRVRDAREADLPYIQSIYADYVLKSFATFEESPPTREEMHARWESTVRAGLPFLIAEFDERVVGYAYATAWRARPAYRYTVEDSVYVAEEFHSRGIGRALLEALIERCEAGDWRQMIAVIALRGEAASIALHRALGFQSVGTLKAVGFKHGQWVDTLLMQRALGRDH
jgi:phosphinothricin acetyltransferase